MSEQVSEPGGSELASASTILSSWYSDPDILSAEERSVFGASWQLAGRSEQVREPGDYFTATVAGESLIVVRGRDGGLRALSNVCRHRAGPVTSGCGRKKSFQCGYHGWSYGLDGTLLAMPEFEGVESFRKEDHPLPAFGVGEWSGLVFVNLEPASEPLDRWLGEVRLRLGGRDLEAFQLTARKEWFLDCNWKVYVDNYLEGYHIPVVHPALYEELDYARYETETLRISSIQHSPIRNPVHLRKGEGEGGDEALFLWVYPNLMLNIYPDNFSTNLILPLGPHRTVTIFEWFFRDPAAMRASGDVERTVSFSDQVQLEDIAICEAVQRGLHSRTYDRGRYSVRRENGVHHFHQLLRHALGRDR